jgi:dTDP-glucose 4,6-dehydratase
MKILVTGGAGFIASNFLHYLSKKHPEYEIFNLDKLTYAGNLKNVAELEKNPNYTFIKEDIANKEAIDRLCAEHKFDVIINFAAETHVDRSISGPDIFIKTNVEGTHALLEAVRRNRIPLMIQFSTDEVFGTAPGDTEFSEESPFNPSNPYSASKAAADLLCHAYWTTYRTPVIVSHTTNVYGPRQYPEKVIPRITSRLMQGQTATIHGDGRPIREWIHTDDVSLGVERILELGKAGEVYNLGSRDRLENIEMIKLIIKFLDRDFSSLEYIDDRPGQDMRYALNSDKVRKQLNWKPQVNLEEGLKNSIEWYQKNPDWWQETN